MDLSEAGVDVTADDSVGSATFTATTYRDSIVFYGGTGVAAIADSGTYVATRSGLLARSSLISGRQDTVAYTLSNGTLTVHLSVNGFPVVQVWQPH